jgi:hypothetical protein
MRGLGYIVGVAIRGGKHDDSMWCSYEGYVGLPT